MRKEGGRNGGREEGGREEGREEGIREGREKGGEISRARVPAPARYPGPFRFAQTSMVATRVSRLLSLESMADRSGECDPPALAFVVPRARMSRFSSSRSWWTAVLGSSVVGKQC